MDSDSGTLARDRSKRAVGVVCSNDDLKAIVHRHKRRLSPAVSPTTEFAAAAASPSFVRQRSDDVVLDRTRSSDTPLRVVSPLK